MTTKQDLEQMFKSETGLRKLYEPEEYYNWIEDKLIEKIENEYDTSTIQRRSGYDRDQRY